VENDTRGKRETRHYIVVFELEVIGQNAEGDMNIIVWRRHDKD
jgi:hypothetical protein